MPKQKIHSYTDDVLQDHDAVALAALIKNKEIKAEEVVAASIARAKKVDPTLHAVVTDSYDKAMEEVKTPGEGVFSGIPTFIKDLAFVKGLPTYFGSAGFSNVKPATKNDPIVEQIFAQGFVNLGMSSMPEFGFSCSTEVPHQEDTRNPWNTKHTAGGSSGGAAALVAAGVVPIAHSADGGGSTRIPAACCGLVGLKPSRGRILLSSIFEKQAVDVAIDGVITRSVRDTAHFYAEAEKYYKNPKLRPVGLVERASKKKYKIGFTSESIKDYKSDEKTISVLQNSAELLESMGHTVKQIGMPVKDQFSDDFITMWSMGGFMINKFGRQLFGSSFNPKNMTKLMHGLSKKFGKEFYKAPFSIYRLRKSYSDYKKLLQDLDVDLLLTPTLSHLTPELGYLNPDLDFELMFSRMANWACYTPYANACGAPSISLPLGHDEEKDLPIGMMLWANHGREDLLLDISYQVEEAQPWRKITAAQ